MYHEPHCVLFDATSAPTPPHPTPPKLYEPWLLGGVNRTGVVNSRFFAELSCAFSLGMKFTSPAELVLVSANEGVALKLIA